MTSSRRYHLGMFLGLAAAMGLAGASSARAQDRDSRCANRVEKDRDDLQRAVDRYGFDSPQAQHERDELRRDAQNCGYYDDNRYRNDGWGDRDDRWRDNNRDYDGYGRSGYNSPAYDIGYRDGVSIGQRDSQKGKSFRPDKNDQYEDADNGYNKRYGDKNDYKALYREGFRRGYSEGYKRWR